MRYAQTAQKTKADNWITAFTALDDSTRIAICQSVTLPDYYAAYRKINRYLMYFDAGGYYVGLPFFPLSLVTWLWEPVSETTNSAVKTAPLFNRRMVSAAWRSILIRGLPREWENNGELEAETEWEARYLDVFGFAYDRSVSTHDARAAAGYPHWPGSPDGPSAPVDVLNAMPDADDLADTLYAPWESTIPYASL